jgi:hypothetical protein
MRFRIVPVTLVFIAISLTSASGAQKAAVPSAARVPDQLSWTEPVGSVAGDAPAVQCGKDSSGRPIPCNPRPCTGRICPLIRFLRSGS